MTTIVHNNIHAHAVSLQRGGDLAPGTMQPVPAGSIALGAFEITIIIII